MHSRRPESRNAFAARLERDLGKKIIVTDDWESCVRGADIVVEASRLEKPAPMLKTEWIKQGRLRHSLRHHERGRALAHRHHGQDGDGRLGPGQGRARSARCARMSTAAGCPSADLHAELGQIVAGLKPGRESDDETNLFWHRGLSLSDIALGAAMLAEGASGWASASDCASAEVRMMPIANARMYSATAVGARPTGKTCCAGCWRAPASTGTVIDYDAPAPLTALWARDDLGLAMMCGLPFSQRAAAPDADRRAACRRRRATAAGRSTSPTSWCAPIRRSQRLEDTFGGVVGYTAGRLDVGRRRASPTTSRRTARRTGRALYRAASAD